ncbi:hypothetical protein FisN_6Lh249 [Fistulifera solaris]|uniref:Uncharacterized protein n=1 Tax=Fistulifera solaris TaxID=1519565 RepID=A0A1Z5J5V5_FISSO|nr:hypothetical protein FisN_6Lh249 [Fistulifera solaris]|eukprot:GAX09377.1 hypothetical protein FisN_6Lh249 [Fistulifera solaris]
MSRRCLSRYLRPAVSQSYLLPARGSLFHHGIHRLNTQSLASGSPSSVAYSSNSGDIVFHEYLQAEERIRTLKEENEKKRSEELYRAWQKSSQRAKNSKSTGVAVIKTIVKQANKSNDDNESKDIQWWEQRATALLQEAAETHEHPEALVRLANLSLDTISETTIIDTEVIRDEINRILGYYDKACRLGSKEGCFNHGNLVWTGFTSNQTPILVPNPKLALGSFQKAIDLGDTDSMYFLGVVLLSEEDDNNEVVQTVTRSERKKMGLEFIERAASLHHPGALYYLSIFYLNGNEELGIPPCNPQEFAKRLDAAVDAGDAEALFLRGHSFYCGDTPPYPVDYTRALQDFLTAAELGHADAAISAGAILHQPHPGVEQDQRRAFLLYQQAGELGSKEGWRNVVACYVNGEGVPQSHETAKYIAETMLKEEDE